MRYMCRDVQRRAERYDIPFTNEPPYPVDPDNLANRVGVLAAVVCLLCESNIPRLVYEGQGTGRS